VVLVSNNYLGSINHTLLTIEALKYRNIPVIGIVFSGEEVISSRQYILKHGNLPMLFSIPQFSEINAATIATFVNNNNIKLS